MPSPQKPNILVLPPEIMIMIFFCVLRDAQDHPRSLPILSHLSAPIRQLALSVSSFWSSINITSSSDGSQELARLFILRSGQSPLDLTLWLWNEIDVESILDGHVSRIKSLSVSPPSAPWLRAFFLFLCQYPMLLLETIEELCDTGSVFRVSIALPSAERLHSITISGIILEYLTTPENNHVKNLQFESDRQWCKSQIARSILPFPELQRLSFHGLRTEIFDIESFDWNGGSTPCCQELRELSITYARSSFIGWVLKVLSAPNLETVQITEPDTEYYDWSEDLQRWRGGTFSTVRNLLLLHNINRRSYEQLPETFVEVMNKHFPNVTRLQLSMHRIHVLGIWQKMSAREGCTPRTRITSVRIADEPRSSRVYEARLEVIVDFVRWFKALEVLESETRMSLETERGRSL